MLRQMDWRNEFAALTRTRYVERVMGPLPQLHADTHFRFLPLSPEVHLGDCVSNLSVERQKELWMVFFPVSYTHLDVYKRQGGIHHHPPGLCLREKPSGQ